MADTARTKAEVLALLADNTTNEISAQDLRDLVVSILPGVGTMNMQGNAAATTISVAGTYVKAAGTTVAATLQDFTMPATNRLQYNGAPDVYATAFAGVSMVSASNSQILGLRIAKNGDATATEAVASTIRRKTGTGADVGAAFVGFECIMSTGDYLELFVTNESGTTTVTTTELYFKVEVFLN